MSNDKDILELTGSKAKEYFLLPESYSSIDLPKYFIFEKLLSNVNKFLEKKNIKDFFKKNKVSECENVNYKIISNKDSNYAWRPIQLIHPVLYVGLVNFITEEKNWEKLKKRFKEFRSNSKIECVSIPVQKKNRRKTLKSQQILNWWEKFEQKSLEQSLDFSYLYKTDIADCYSSIYTHTIAWAIETKNNAKKEKNKGLGNEIDLYIRWMSYGQTNGIPQGSVLMDFIAEIVLGYADSKLTEKISGIKDYKIIRYRDDYNVFVNNSQDGEKIVKDISDVLIDLGLKLNSTKTLITNDIISGSIKNDKLHWIEHGKLRSNNQKQLLSFYALSKKYPNSGMLMRLLVGYFNNFLKKTNDNVWVLISIAAEIGYNNPRVFHIIIAIISKLLLYVNDEEKKNIVNKIYKKFNKKPNTGYLEIWLQRLSYKIDKSIEFNEKLCQLVKEGTHEIWNSDWVGNNELKKIISAENIIDFKILETMDEEIKMEEIDLFGTICFY